MNGRKPIPSWRRRLEGNPGKRPLNEAEPRPPSTDDTWVIPPRELAEVPTALQEWQRLAPMLHRARQITDADRAALLALCLEWARYLDASERVRTSGMVIQTPNGYPIPNPYLSIATKALSGCTKLWPELGLTPSSRTRVVAAAQPDADPFTEFDQAPAVAPTRPQLIRSRGATEK
jgi:P27 family predicted phage terminase small subunit